MVIPLDLAITPMKVLEDPLIGPACRSLYEEGEEDDRLLIMLFLTVERLRKNSTWKPYVYNVKKKFYHIGFCRFELTNNCLAT